MKRHDKRSCVGKHRYKTMNEAQMEIDRAAEFRGETQRAYTCRLCKKIHLTSMDLETYNKFASRS